MIDLHSHILPGLDDGAKDLDYSLRMLESAHAQGVTRLCATSHASLAANERYDETFHLLKQEAAKCDIELLPGMEYDYDALSNFDWQHLRTLGNSRALLVDLKESVLPASVQELFYEISRHEYQIVVAHPERLFHRDIDAVLTALSPHDPCWQVNAGSLLGRYGESVRQAAWRLLDEGHCHWIASDAHRSGHFQIRALRRLLLNYYPERCVNRWLIKNPELLLNDELTEAPHPPKLNWLQRWRRKREKPLA